MEEKVAYTELVFGTLWAAKTFSTFCLTTSSHVWSNLISILETAGSKLECIWTNF